MTPILNNIIFKFTEEVVKANGKQVLKETTNWGFKIVSSFDDQAKKARVGEIVYLSEAAKKEGLDVGMLILIEPLMWTTSVEVDGEQLWKTDVSKVLAVLEPD